MKAEPTPTKLATDKIVAYLPKLNEFELGRISSAIKAIRASKKNKTQLTFDVPINGEEKNPA